MTPALAAASTQTTILPTARTTLSMAVYQAFPKSFARIHRQYLTPTVSTVAMGAVSVLLYVIMNYVSSGNVIADSVSALGLMIAYYYGLTGFACAWYFRHDLRRSARELMLKGVIPALGGLILLGAFVKSVLDDWKIDTGYTFWTMQFPPHWQIGGIFVLAVGAMLLGVVLMLAWWAKEPAFFRGQVLTRDTPVLVTEEGLPVGTPSLPDAPAHQHQAPPDQPGTAEPEAPGETTGAP